MNTDPERNETPRIVAAVAGLAVVIGSIGPWATTFLVDKSGIEGDGVITLILAVGVLAILGLAPHRRGLLIVATVLAILSAMVGVYDLIDVSSSTQELFGREVKVVDPGWGLWLTAIASVVLVVAAWFTAAQAQRTGYSGTAPPPPPPPPGAAE